MSGKTAVADRPRGKQASAPDAGEIWRLLDEIAARGRAIRLARQAAESGTDVVGPESAAGDAGARNGGGAE